ncbi:MBL fold metallo-hydrolase [Salinibacter grassmerensis]|uniref:MBL fold metallo-hydrolase n=1 Tax=Salinibacter grassmerensis TaxID=3040353 RepID=UPI0021E94A5A|nr:MBL fold metallo-hydrolase [Salinibacter grassmerensis]
MLFRRISDEKLAQYAYLIGCQETGEALLVDPERDIDRYLNIAKREGLEITAVAETHIHADFLSGARELAERTDAALYLSDEGPDDWKYEWAQGPTQSGGDYDVTWLYDGDTFAIGNIEITAVHTPGHTPEHLSFLVTDRGGGATAPMGLLSGDFLFVGDLGRPDLLESAAQVEGAMEPAARTLYESVQRVLEMPDHLQVWPGHGAGSACGKALGAVPQSTLGYEKQFNPMIEAAREGEEAFVESILAGQPEPPTYFARMKRDNKEGMPVLGGLPSPSELTVRELEDAVTSEGPTGEKPLIIDTRPGRSAYMAGHIPGSLCAPMNGSFSTVVGSLVEDENAPIVLIADEEDVEEAVRDLVRIGYDNVTGFAEIETLQRYFEAGGPSETIDEITFADFGAELQDETTGVLDVRYRLEHEEGHVEGAINVSYTRLPEREADLPEGKTLLVHCASGARAAAASSYLARAGHSVKYVNDHFRNYEPDSEEAVTA